MKDLNNLTKIGNVVKRVAQKYLPFSRKAETQEEISNECPEINYQKHNYNESEVDRSFMNTSSF